MKSELKPSDDAILIAASNLAAALAQLRRRELSNAGEPDEPFNYGKQEQRLANMLGWAIEQVQIQIKGK
ncbi:hypothetical protein [Croceibacterium aestuarii]|uniref:hypothetical protein n=1 Tax=Croceibacterium aestuarii TaxID=3064139 RepID=UPI00272E2C2C|nr:hypothetical protein [Croceibacterium sp. D39]